MRQRRSAGPRRVRGPRGHAITGTIAVEIAVEIRQGASRPSPARCAGSSPGQARSRSDAAEGRSRSAAGVHVPGVADQLGTRSRRPERRRATPPRYPSAIAPTTAPPDRVRFTRTAAPGPRRDVARLVRAGPSPVACSVNSSPAPRAISVGDREFVAASTDERAYTWSSTCRSEG